MTDIDALFLTRYGPKGGSSRYRFLQYFPRLEAAGINCMYLPLFGERYLTRLYQKNQKDSWSVAAGYLRRLRDFLRFRRFDILILEKELFPYVPAIFERILGKLATPYIVDYDDAIFHNYDMSDNRFVRHFLGRKIDVVMREADAVIAGNEYLASRARKAGSSRVEIVPTVVNLDRYPYVPLEEGGPFTIGWIGTPTTFEYVQSIVGALRTACEEIDASLTFVGSGPVDFDGMPVNVITWSRDTEIESLSKFDVGVVPLEDGPWERGKCNLKLIQYMACCKPVVASPVGMNNSVVTEGVNGYFASTEDEWLQRLKLLADDIQLARRLGRNGRARVQEEYCLSVTAPKLIGLINNLVD